jgi:signal transduction histidine kinase
LDLSRLAVGSLELVILPVDLRELASYIREDLSIQAKEKGLRFELDIDETLPELIQHDEERLTQIMSNLLVNAIKYTQDGEVKLTLRHTPNALVIVVSDTGTGSPDDMQLYIFENFAQIKNSDQNQGVGLGLSIVKNLTELMGGRVFPKSKPHEYTIFTVELPLNLYSDGDFNHE